MRPQHSGTPPGSKPIILVCLVVLCWCSDCVAAQGDSVEVNTEEEFIRGVFNESVRQITVRQDVLLTQQAWDAVEKERPYVRQNNLTIVGAANVTEGRVVLNISYLKRRIRAGTGITIRFINLRLRRFKQPSAYNAAGVDLFVMASISNLELINVTSHYEVCMPLQIIAQYYKEAGTRPRDQEKGVLLANGWCEPGCTNSSSRQCCWSMGFNQIDFMPRNDRLEEDGTRSPLPIPVRILDTTVVCDSPVSLSCIGRNATAYCFHETLSKVGLLWADNFDLAGRQTPSTPPLTSPLPLPSPAQSPPVSDDSSSSSVPLEIVLPACILGGLAVLALAGLAVYVVRSKHRKAKQKGVNKGEGEEEDKDAYDVERTPDSKDSLEPQDSVTTSKFGYMAAVEDLITSETKASVIEIDFETEIQILPNTERGIGGCGVVVECMYQGQRCAAKMLHPGLYYTFASNSSESDALKKEVEVLSRCDHPNIVRCLGASLKPPNMCIVEELMVCSLGDLIYGKEDLDLEQILNIARDIAAGLAYLHPTVIHRDLKPGNVLLAPNGVAKISDFGLARLRALGATTLNAPTEHPESGTTQYLSPENFDQVKFGPVTHKSDIYALGVIMWEMLTRQQPWGNSAFVAIAFAITIKKQRLELPEDEARCPRRLRKLIQEMWDEEPARRPSAADIVKRIRLIQQRLYGTQAAAGGTAGSTISGPGTGTPAATSAVAPTSAGSVTNSAPVHYSQESAGRYCHKSLSGSSRVCDSPDQTNEPKGDTRVLTASQLLSVNGAAGVPTVSVEVDEGLPDAQQQPIREGGIEPKPPTGSNGVVDAEVHASAGAAGAAAAGAVPAAAPPGGQREAATLPQPSAAPPAG